MPITLYQYLNERAQALSPSLHAYCQINAALREYVELSRLLQAAGHDTTQLDAAISAIKRDVNTLHDTARNAQTTFAQQGIKAIRQSHAKKTVFNKPA